jgi:hypothetical protein
MIAQDLRSSAVLVFIIKPWGKTVEKSPVILYEFYFSTERWRCA